MDSSSSSSSSVTQRHHASSVSSASSSASEPPAPARRLTLTIPPLRIRPPTTPSTSQPTDASSNSRTVRTTNGQDVSKKVTHKIKLKAKNSVFNETSVESPLPDTGSRIVPPRPPAIQKQKVPRPAKLKPLREVLSKLISQIKKKDDYAFYLEPVDQSRVPGYADVVKNPMDFGTMTLKVEGRRYRSLDDFTADFRLVISNAQAFNPPDSIYYTEAARIEHYGLEQIAKAAAQVIEFETDWTIDDVTQEGEQLTSIHTMQVDGADGADFTAKGNGSPAQERRSPSILSVAQPVGMVAMSERSRRSRKKVPIVSESWEPGGRLPGSSDGLGAFPPGSDMANLMLQLKLRGKIFRNKKERIRIERAGIPYNADGSLALSLMEHPFTVMNTLAPELLSLPKLTPLIVTQTTSPDVVEDTSSQTGASQPPEDRSATTTSFGPVNLPVESVSSIFTGYVAPSSVASIKPSKKRFRHWNVTRNANNRSRTRDVDDVEEPPPKKQKASEVTDYGSFAMLLGAVATEQGIRASEFRKRYGTNQKVLETLKATLDVQSSAVVAKKSSEENRSPLNAALDSEGYVQDIVYGGLDGLAYIRSVEEFVGRSQRHDVKSEADLRPGDLGVPLASWVEANIIDPLTQRNHIIIRDVIAALCDQPLTPVSEQLASYISLAKSDKSALQSTVSELRQLTAADSLLDIASLLKAPHELFLAESEWAGSSYKSKREQEREQAEATMVKANAMDFLAFAIESHRQGEAEANARVATAVGQPTANSDTAELVEHALSYGAEALRELDRRLREGESFSADGAQSVEDSILRKVRLNLIAIAKRAPLDKIARLPPELVPPHIRHIVPTISS